MSNYLGTVIKSGNSYALRIPKKLVDEADLSLGEKVSIGQLSKYKRQDPKKIREAIERLQASNAFKDIKDPVAWQREQRKDRSLPFRD